MGAFTPALFGGYSCPKGSGCTDEAPALSVCNGKSCKSTARNLHISTSVIVSCKCCETRHEITIQVSFKNHICVDAQ